MLKQLVYLSKVVGDISDADIDNILAASRRNNPALGITGLLVVKDRTFIQVLEGEGEAVHDLFQRLQEDPRHKDVSLISWEQIEQRAFPNWSMGFKQAKDLANDKLLNLERINITELTQNPGELHDLLQALLDIE
jgi:hypothetical protein